MLTLLTVGDILRLVASVYVRMRRSGSSSSSKRTMSSSGGVTRSVGRITRSSINARVGFVHHRRAMRAVVGAVAVRAVLRGAGVGIARGSSSGGVLGPVVQIAVHARINLVHHGGSVRTGVGTLVVPLGGVRGAASGSCSGGVLDTRIHLISHIGLMRCRSGHRISSGSSANLRSNWSGSAGVLVGSAKGGGVVRGLSAHVGCGS